MLKGAKPEGVPSELADIVIRVLDFIKYMGFEYPFHWTMEELQLYSSLGIRKESFH